MYNLIQSLCRVGYWVSHILSNVVGLFSGGFSKNMPTPSLSSHLSSSPMGIFSRAYGKCAQKRCHVSRNQQAVQCKEWRCYVRNPSQWSKIFILYFTWFSQLLCSLENWVSKITWMTSCGGVDGVSRLFSWLSSSSVWLSLSLHY